APHKAGDPWDPHGGPAVERSVASRSFGQQAARLDRQGGWADHLVGLVGRIDTGGFAAQAALEVGHAESRAGADRPPQLELAVEDSLPDRDAVVQVADVPEVVRPGSGQAADNLRRIEAARI